MTIPFPYSTEHDLGEGYYLKEKWKTHFHVFALYQTVGEWRLAGPGSFSGLYGRELRYRAPDGGRSYHIASTEYSKGWHLVVSPKMIAPGGGAIAFIKWRSGEDKRSKTFSWYLQESVCVWQPGWKTYRELDSVEFRAFPFLFNRSPLVFSLRGWSEDAQSLLYEKWVFDAVSPGDIDEQQVRERDYADRVNETKEKEYVRRYMKKELWRWKRGMNGEKELVSTTAASEALR